MNNEDLSVNSDNKIYFILSLAALLVFGLMRAYDLNADLASYFDTGISLTDEGTYMDAPKKKVQTGQWNLEGEWWHSQKLTPLFAYTMRYWFEMFGVSLSSGRSLSVVLSILTLSLCWLVGQRYYGHKGGFALLVFVGSSYILTQFNRAAMVESMQLLFVWLGIYLLSFEQSKKREFFIGFLITLTLLVKLSGLIAWAGIGLWYFCSNQVWKQPKILFCLVGGSLSPLLISEIFQPGVLWKGYQYGQENFGRLLSIKHSPWHLLHISVRSMYLSREAPMVAIAILGLFKVIKDERFRHASWALVGSILLCCCVDMAVRRYLLFMPWLYLLALAGLCASHKKRENKKNLFDLMAKLLGIYLLLSGIPMVLGHFNIIPTKIIVVAAVLGSLWLVLLDIKQQRLSHAICKLKAPYAVSLSLVLLLGVSQYLNWFTQRHHYVQNVQTALKKHYREPQVIYGNIAPMMAIESNCQAYFLYKTMGDPQKWNFPKTLDLITYSKPKFGYEVDYIKTFANQYNNKKVIAGPWKMLDERHIKREVTLYRLSHKKN